MITSILFYDIQTFQTGLLQMSKPKQKEVKLGW